MRYLIGALIPRPFIGALIGAGASIAGALIGRKGQKEANVANAQQADQMMEFQERMSHNQHQREVADLRAAGLNPILSGTGGAGAAVPSGAMAKMENVDENTAATAQQIAMNTEAFQNLKATRKQIEADTTQKVQDAYRTSATAERERQHGELILQQRLTEKEETQRAHHNASIAASQAKGAELEGQIDETSFGKIMRYIGRALGAVNSGSSAIRNIK